MATSNLTQLWSIPSTADQKARLSSLPYAASRSAPATEEDHDPDAYPIHEFLVNRWIAHYVAAVLSTVPSSETRLRNEALIPIYNQLRDLLTILQGALEERHISLPPVPAIQTDWSAEAAIDHEALREALSPRVDGWMKQYIQSSIATIADGGGGGNHWSSSVANIAVLADTYLNPATRVATHHACTEAPAATDGSAAKYERLVKYTQRLTGGGGAGESTRVLMQETIRIRSVPGESGWREDEAKGMAKGLMMCLDKYVVG